MQPLQDAFHLYFGRFLLILLVTLLIYVPLNSVVTYLEWYVLDASDMGASMRISNALEGVFGPISSGAIVFAIWQAAEGRAISTGTALSAGLKNWGRLFITRILAGLHIMVGLLLLIVPGILIALNYSFVDYVVVTEETSGTRALQRSKELTQGMRAKLFLCGVLFYALVMILSIAAYFALDVLPGLQAEAAYMAAEVVIATSIDLIIVFLQVLFFVFFWDRIGGRPISAPTTFGGDEFEPADASYPYNFEDPSNPYRAPRDA